MVIKDNSVKAINTALLDIQKQLDEMNKILQKLLAEKKESK
mgnify:CR=1 FL=1|jgi:hypothetical protein